MITYNKSGPLPMLLRRRGRRVGVRRGGGGGVVVAGADVFSAVIIALAMFVHISHGLIEMQSDKEKHGMYYYSQCNAMYIQLVSFCCMCVCARCPDVVASLLIYAVKRVLYDRVLRTKRGGLGGCGQLPGWVRCVEWLGGSSSLRCSQFVCVRLCRSSSSSTDSDSDAKPNYTRNRTYKLNAHTTCHGECVSNARIERLPA